MLVQEKAVSVRPAWSEDRDAGAGWRDEGEQDGLHPGHQQRGAHSGTYTCSIQICHDHNEIILYYQHNLNISLHVSSNPVVVSSHLFIIIFYSFLNIKQRSF